MKVLETLTGLWTKGLYMARRKVALASTFLQGVDPRIYVTFVFSKCLLNKELCERLGLGFHEAWVVTLIGFAAWLFLNLAENLEDKRPPQKRPTQSGGLHRMLVRDRQVPLACECLHLGIGVDLMWGCRHKGQRGICMHKFGAHFKTHAD